MEIAGRAPSVVSQRLAGIGNCGGALLKAAQPGDASALERLRGAQ